MNLDRKIFAAIGVFSILAGSFMLSDGDSSGGWPAVLIGGAILLHIAFSKRL